MKIIFIISFPPKYGYYKSVKPDKSWNNLNNQEIGVWRIDWGHVFAKDIKTFYPNIDYEVWRPDYRADKEYVHKFDDGVIHRSFPAKKTYFRRGLKKEIFYYSDHLVSALEKIVNGELSKNTIVHVPVDFSPLSYLLLKKFKGKIPFFHTSHLNPFLLTPCLKTFNPFKLAHRFFIRKTYRQHMKIFREIAVTEDRIDFFRKNTHANVYTLNSLNFDFSWIRNKTSKEDARKKLGLPINEFIVFSSSRLVPEKQLDKMLLSFSPIRNKKFLCIISGSGEKVYIEYLKNLVEKLDLVNHVVFVGFLTDNLMDYYCAADVFISTSVSEAGPVSVIKAMALGIPVISTDTGIAAYLLKKHHAGLLLHKSNTKKWTTLIESLINGKEIKIIDPLELEKEYRLENSIHQLVSYYQKTIDNYKNIQSK